jgi:Tfp pilus assembly protein PilF
VAVGVAAWHILGWVPGNLLFLNLGEAMFNGKPLPSLPGPLQPPVAEQAFARGWVAWMAGDAPTAESAWGIAMRANERFMPAVWMTASPDTKLAELAVTLYPDRAEGWNWLGDLYATNNPAKAVDYYQKAAALSPLDNLIWENLSNQALEAGNRDLALVSARKACDLVPIRNGACHNAARLAYEKGDWQTVITYFVRGSYPEHAEDWVLLIRAAQKANQPDEATRFLALAHERLPADYESLVRAAP